jgi:hypothetical protein
VIKYLAAVRERHQGPERAGRHIPPKFQIAYLFESNLQARLMEQLLYLWAEDLLEGHLLDVQGQEVRVRYRRYHRYHRYRCHRHVHYRNLIRKNRGRGGVGGLVGGSGRPPPCFPCQECAACHRCALK